MAKHLFIATPCHSGEVVCEHAVSLVETIPALLQNRIGYTHSFLVGDALVHDARNRLTAWFMEHRDATDMLMIDADIAWRAVDAVRLAAAPHDVIAGCYRQKRDDAVAHNVAGLQTGPTRLMTCDYVGAGFLKISRNAIRRLYDAHPELRYQDPHGKECYGLFDAPIGDGKIVGEDAQFCRRWRALGGKIFIDPDIELVHFGRKGFAGSLGAAAEAFEAGAGAA